MSKVFLLAPEITQSFITRDFATEFTLASSQGGDKIAVDRHKLDLTDDTYTKVYIQKY